MDKWREVTRRLVLCLVGVAVLAACTPEGGPVVTDSPSSSVAGSVTATASPSPSVSPSVDVLAELPEDAKSPGLDGAIATAEFFLTLYAPMFQSGDTRLWDALSGPECGYCADASENADEVQVRGWVAQGGEILPTADAPGSYIGDDGRAYVFIPAHLNDALLVKDEGTPEVSEPASDQVFIMQLELRDNVWLVQGVKFEDS